MSRENDYWRKVARGECIDCPAKVSGHRRCGGCLEKRRQYAARVAREGTQKIVGSRWCLWCGMKIVNRPVTAKYCCYEHKELAHNANRENRTRTYRGSLKKTTGMKHSGGGTSVRQVIAAQDAARRASYREGQEWSPNFGEREERKKKRDERRAKVKAKIAAEEEAKRQADK